MGNEAQASVGDERRQCEMSERAARAMSAGGPESEFIAVMEELKRAGWRMNAPANEDGDTALAIAALMGRCDVIEWLIGAGADCSIIVRSGGVDALACAAIYGHERAVGILAEACSHDSPDPKDLSRAALSLALQSGYLGQSGLEILIAKAPDSVLGWSVDYYKSGQCVAYEWCDAPGMCEAELSRRAIAAEVGEAGAGKGAAPRI